MASGQSEVSALLNPSCIHEGRNVVGECPVWDADAQVLYWVDVNRGEVHRMDAAGSVDTWRFGEPVSAVSLTTSADVPLVAVGGNLLLWSPSDDTRTVFAAPRDALAGDASE